MGKFFLKNITTILFPTIRNIDVNFKDPTNLEKSHKFFKTDFRERIALSQIQSYHLTYM